MSTFFLLKLIKNNKLKIYYNLYLYIHNLNLNYIDVKKNNKYSDSKNCNIK